MADRRVIEVGSQGEIIVDPERFFKFSFSKGYSWRKELGLERGHKRSSIRPFIEDIFKETLVYEKQAYESGQRKLTFLFDNSSFKNRVEKFGYLLESKKFENIQLVRLINRFEILEEKKILEVKKEKEKEYIIVDIESLKRISFKKINDLSKENKITTRKLWRNRPDLLKTPYLKAKLENKTLSGFVSKLDFIFHALSEKKLFPLLCPLPECGIPPWELSRPARLP